uniref:Uncharacterized protein n=1 Tax=Panagrolaimus sp. ES5 TaxID=591445 RepID=A0AC34GHD3_9BILA
NPRSSGFPTAVSPAIPPPAASRRQSISNVLLPSTRTGREVTPRPSESNLATARSDPALRTARGGRAISPAPPSSGYHTAISAATPPPPASRRQSISNVYLPSTRTGREVTPRPSESRLVTARSDPARTGRGVSPTPRSSGYPTAVATTPSRQSNVQLPSTRTGRDVTPPGSFRQQQPSVATGVSDKSTRTARENSPLLPP